jgi:hypothetical protein
LTAHVDVERSIPGRQLTQGPKQLGSESISWRVPSAELNGV